MKEIAQETGEVSKEETPKTPPNIGISRIDFVLRMVAVIATLGSTIAVATSTTNGVRPFLARFTSFSASYQDLPTFKFFVVVNAITAAYLVLSLVLSIFHIFKSGVKVTRIVLIALDMIILALLISAASAAAAIVHLAHTGNVQANWIPICQQYNSFCERVSGSLVGSFIGILVLMLLIILSAVALSR